jgi:hypothetical protein
VAERTGRPFEAAQIARMLEVKRLQELRSLSVALSPQAPSPDEIAGAQRRGGEHHQAREGSTMSSTARPFETAQIARLAGGGEKYDNKRDVRSWWKLT